METTPRMNAAVAIHDDYQIELKLNHPLPRRSTKTFYEVGLYVFAPLTKPKDRITGIINIILKTLMVLKNYRGGDQ